MHSFCKWKCIVLIVFINLYWNCCLYTRRRLFSFCSTNLNVEGAINNGYKATLPILVSRTKIVIPLFHVLPETLPPTLNSCFQKLLFHLSSISSALVSSLRTAIWLWLISSMGGGGYTLPVWWFRFAMNDACFHTFREMLGTYTARMVTAIVRFPFSQMGRRSHKYK